MLEEISSALTGLEPVKWIGATRGLAVGVKCLKRFCKKRTNQSQVLQASDRKAITEAWKDQRWAAEERYLQRG